MKPRPEVQWFAEEMERVLQRNDHKGGWQSMGHWEIHQRISEEFGEVTRTLAGAEGGSLLDELVDVANFCMFMADNLQPTTVSERLGLPPYASQRSHSEK